MTQDNEATALVFGAGPGLGAAIARRCARGGMQVAVAARDATRLDERLPELRAAGAPRAGAYACDVTDEALVEDAFRRVREELGRPHLVVFNAGAFVPRGLLDTEADEFERCWRVGCLGGFLVGRAAAREMLAGAAGADGARGTILFTGATASLRGGSGFHNLAVGKFGLRALAQSMAREFQPQGIHVGHVIIDGQIAAPERDPAYDEGERGPDTLLHPDAIAETYWQLYQQPRNAWSHEVDLRPWSERF